ncbi:MAG TPA: SCO family protein [Candidatus Bathyarchaeia archaeon]|nr:SCO family protein [Candidatus Bathyarchaeia archaeon]
MSRRAFVLVGSAALALAVVATRASDALADGAGYGLAPSTAAGGALPAGERPAALRDVGFDQRLDEQVPLDLALRDESGAEVHLGDFFHGKPVVLSLAYFDCPMLCGVVLNGLAGALRTLSFDAGKEFEVLTVSFDPRDTPATAAGKKAAYLERYHRPGASAGGHFLTADPPAIDRLTKAAGFRYVWDARTNQFAHPTGVIVVTPDGRLARYLFGIDYGPRDLRLALVEASAGRVGTAADALLLYCYHYDPMTGRYGLLVMRTLRIAAVGTVVSLAAFIVLLIRLDRRRTFGTPGTLGTSGTFGTSGSR